MRIFAVIPAYNEQERIGAVIDDVKRYTDAVVVVDDCSNDGTARVAREHGALVLHHVVNRNQGAALQTGNEYAFSNGADIIIHIDADGQHQAKNIPEMMRPIIEGEADIVFGSRFLHGASGNMPFSKKFFIQPVARKVNYLFTRLNLTDAHNGWRAMNRCAAERITIIQDGKAHVTDIGEQVHKLGLRYCEVPVDVVYYEYGQNFWSGVRIVWDLLKRKVIE